MHPLARPTLSRVAAIALAVGAVTVFGSVGQAAADVKPGAYTSTTSAGGAVLLQRTGHVDGKNLVLIGSYPIHSTADGGYVDFFPGHRVFLRSDGHGGYRGPAYLGGALVGTFTLTPHR